MTDDHRHLLLIGGQRCGTTWLRDVLSAHPDVVAPFVERPEPKFLLDDDDHGRYDRLFPPLAGRWALDKSTTYLECAAAAARAATCVPSAAVIAVLRDPVERAFSNWRFSTAHGLEDLPVDDAMRPEAEHRPYEGLSTSPYQYLRRGSYAALLTPWVEAFGDRLVVLQHERLIAAAGSDHLRERLATVGLGAVDGWPGAHPPVNAAPGAADLDAAIAGRLADHFRASNEALSTLGIDPSLWSGHS